MKFGAFCPRAYEYYHWLHFACRVEDEKRIVDVYAPVFASKKKPKVIELIENDLYGTYT